MCGYSDLVFYSDDEARDVLAEFARALGIAPPSPATAAAPPCGADLPLDRAVAGEPHLDPSIVEHAKWRVPASTITAPEPQLATYDVLSERNRNDYIAQSAATRDGCVPEFHS